MDISILLATFKRSNLLYQTLESFCLLKSEKLRWEILVVDNAGDGDTRQIVEKFRNSLNISYLIETNRGKNKALNNALEKAKGKLIVITDDDIIANNNWLIEMWEGASRWPEHSIFGGRIIPKFPQGKIPIPKEHPFFYSAYVLADWNITEGPYKAWQVWGPNMALRADILKKGWQFNPNIGPNGTNNYIMGSETELTIRLEQAGFIPIYLPKSLVYHQIRPEQLTDKWLYERSFREGRHRALLSELKLSRLLFEVLRCLKELVRAAIMRLLYFFDAEKVLDYGIIYWNIKGIIYQHSIEIRKKLRK